MRSRTTAVSTRSEPTAACGQDPDPAQLQHQASSSRRLDTVDPSRSHSLLSAGQKSTNDLQEGSVHCAPSERLQAFSRCRPGLTNRLGDASGKADALAGRRVLALPRSVASSPLAAASFLFLRLKSAISGREQLVESLRRVSEGERMQEARADRAFAWPRPAAAARGQETLPAAGLSPRSCSNAHSCTSHSCSLTVARAIKNGSWMVGMKTIQEGARVQCGGCEWVIEQ